MNISTMMLVVVLVFLSGTTDARSVDQLRKNTGGRKK